MPTWDERYAAGNYPSSPAPHPLLVEYVQHLDGGRALDVATGTGRNAVFLAEQGFDVDAVDQSREGLRIARDRARGSPGTVEWIQADLTEFPYPTAEYDLVTVSFYRTLDRLTDLKESLVPDGILFYQHHLRATDPIDLGPSTDRYRFAPNELLHACLDMTVLRYEERGEVMDGRRGATAALLARNSTARRQPYPVADSVPTDDGA